MQRGRVYPVEQRVRGYVFDATWPLFPAKTYNWITEEWDGILSAVVPGGSREITLTGDMPSGDLWEFRGTWGTYAGRQVEVGFSYALQSDHLRYFTSPFVLVDGLPQTNPMEDLFVPPEWRDTTTNGRDPGHPMFSLLWPRFYIEVSAKLW